jgi:hypothetical protein
MQGLLANAGARPIPAASKLKLAKRSRVEGIGGTSVATKPRTRPKILPWQSLRWEGCVWGLEFPLLRLCPDHGYSEVVPNGLWGDEYPGP